MFESIINFFKNLMNKESKTKDTARERLQLVLMQDRASVSADYLDLMKQEIIEVIKKYINIDENALQVELTKPKNKDGTYGAPSLYANIPILSIKTEHKVKEENNSKLVVTEQDNYEKTTTEQEKNKTDNSDKKQNANNNQSIKNNFQNEDESKSKKDSTIKPPKEDESKSELLKKDDKKNDDSSKNKSKSNSKSN